MSPDTPNTLGLPPIRSPLTEAPRDSSSQPTAFKDYWLFWERIGRQLAAAQNDIRKAQDDIENLNTQVNDLDATVTELIQSGTHAARLAIAPAAVPLNSLWIETDRSNVVYQVQTVAGVPAWVYVAGTMTGSFSQLPAGLGANDIGFTFATSDTYEIYRWSGSVWVNQTPANDVQIAYSSGNMTLTTAAADVPGAALTLRRAGRYWIQGVFMFVVFGGDAAPSGPSMVGYLNTNGTDQVPAAVYSVAAANASASVAQQWPYTAAVNDVVKLRAWKTGGTGGSIIQAPHTSIAALWIGP